MVAERCADPRLQLLSEQVECVSGLTRRPLAATAGRAESIYQRAIVQGNLLAQWCPAAARMIVAALSGDPANGIVWADRLIPAHVSFGSGGGGAFLEALANFASLTGDTELAARMYGAAYAEIRRVGMVWPIQINTLELVERARRGLVAEDFDRLWTEGQGLTYEAAARDRGLIGGTSPPRC